MALTTEQLVLQMELLTSKTDSTTNPNIIFKPSTVLNKGLDPEFFTGNNTKLVNAINKLAKSNDSTATLVATLGDKFNGILLDISDGANQVLWQNTQNLMGKDTIIEGIEHILKGNRQEQILGLKQKDVGKCLVVAESETGEGLVVKAIDSMFSSAESIPYNNETKPELKTVKDALDFILSKQVEDVIEWDDINSKPMIANGLVLTEDALVMREDEQDISSVPLMNNDDISNILESL